MGHLFLAAIVLAFGIGVAQAACPPDSRIEEWVFGGRQCHAVATFGAETAGPSPVLVIGVHGDISDGGLATYHIAFAKTLARAGLVAVALNRPGYTNDAGRVSDGSTLGREDNYTVATVNALAGAIAALKAHYRPRRVVYVGHSGGAAIGGVLIGTSRGLVDAAVLVSCPCDIPRWLRERGRPPWKNSESPSAHAGRVPRTTRVVTITGSADRNTFPALAEDYAKSLARRGVDARFVLVDGAGHGMSALAAAVTGAVAELSR